MKKIYLIIILALLSINLIDKFPSKLSKEIFNTPNIQAEEKNGDYYLKGFFAPKDQSPEAFGRQLIQAKKDYDMSVDDYMDAMYEASDEAIKTPIIKHEANIKCWYTQQAQFNCISKQQLTQNIDANKTLLGRLEQLAQYNTFDQNEIGLYESISEFRGVNELFFAKIILLHTNNQSEEALILLLDNISLHQKILSGRQNLIAKALSMISIFEGLNTLNILTYEQPSLIKDHENRIQHILSKAPFGKNSFNIRKTAQAEYNSTLGMFKDYIRNTTLINKISAFVLYKSNDSKNQLAHFWNDLEILSTAPTYNFNDHYQQFHEAYGANDFKIQNMLYNPIGNLLLPGMFKGSELIRNQATKAYPKRRMLALCLEARKNNIPYNEMENFIDKSGSSFYNPVSNDPFSWDNKNKELFFKLPKPEIDTITLSCKIKPESI